MKRRREEDGDLRRFRASRLSQPPEEWVEKGLRSIRDAEALAQKSRMSQAQERGIGAVRRFVREIRLVLTLDTLEGAVLAGIRGTVAQEARQFLFESEAGKVHVELKTGAKGKTDLRGIFLPSQKEIASGGQVVLEHGKGRSTRRLTRDGEFVFRGIGPGPHRLRLELGETLLLTDPLDLEGGVDA